MYMAQECCNELCDGNIEIVQGDSFYREITIDGIEPRYIRNIYVTCKHLNINKRLIYDRANSCWVFELSSLETSQLPICRNSYDLTIEFKGNSIATACYHSLFSVFPKENELNKSEVDDDENVLQLGPDEFLVIAKKVCDV